MIFGIKNCGLSNDGAFRVTHALHSISFKESALFSYYFLSKGKPRSKPDGRFWNIVGKVNKYF